MPREELTTPIPFPPPRRQSAAEKARDLLQQDRTQPPEETPGPPPYKKITGRVFPDQQQWVQRVPKEYRRRHPRHPKLTSDELLRIAIEYLRDSADLDAVIARYRT
jgi:hypothetical protein